MPQVNDLPANVTAIAYQSTYHQLGDTVRVDAATQIRVEVFS